MCAQIKIGAIGDSHQLIPLALILLAFWEEAILDVYGALGIMGQLLLRLFIETEIGRRDTKIDKPSVAGIDPFLMRLLVFAWPNKVFHFHLFKFPRTENEIAGRDLVTKRLSNLRDAKRKFAAACRQYVEKIDEYALRSLRTEVDERSGIVFRGSANVSLEHQIERARVREIG